jgi:hypothetical protein
MLYYRNGATTMDPNYVPTEDQVLAMSTVQDAAEVLNFNWPVQTGDITLHLAAFEGDVFPSVDNEVGIIEDQLVLAGNLNGDEIYPIDFSRPGVRRADTEPLGFNIPEDVRVWVDLSQDGSITTNDNAILVQFSTDGGATFTTLQDLGGDTELFNFASPTSFGFDLPAGAKTDNTILRVVQKDANDLGLSELTWDLNDFYYIIGNEYTGGFTSSNLEAPYTIDRPDISVTNVEDEIPATYNNAGNPAYPGDAVTVSASFPNVDNIDDYSYTARFINNDGLNFILDNENVVTDDVAKTITITGDIPLRVPYNDNTWDVVVYPYTGTEPLFGLSEGVDLRFTSQAVVEEDYTVSGASQFNDNTDGIIFDLNGERSFTTMPYDFETVTDAFISFNVNKINTADVYPAGSELILEYSTDLGTTYTQIGSVDLNSDLSLLEPFENLPSGVVSSQTIFRVRQNATFGEDLAPWGLVDFQVASGTNVLTDLEVDYFSFGPIAINEPVISLDNVFVPNDLLYPGDDVDITFSVTEGEFPAGEEFQATIPYGVYDLILGSSAATATTMNIAVPASIGDDYSLKIISSSGAVSNNVFLPVYNTTIEITDIVSSSGIVNGGQPVIYPGDEITVSYDIDGALGAGAELMLEILDYDQPLEENDGYITITSTTTVNGSITATLPTGGNYNGGGPATLRIKIGSGILVSPNLSTVYNNNWWPGDIDPDVFPPSEWVGFTGLFESTSFQEPGLRSAVSVPFDVSNGGLVEFELWGYGPFSSETVYIEGSVDGGATWIEIATYDYAAGYFTGSDVIPDELRSNSTIFRWRSNVDSQLAENENIMDFDGFILNVYQDIVGASDEAVITGFSFPYLSLETLSNNNFVVGETTEVLYTATGNYPANTSFATVLYNDGDFNDAVVIGTSTTTGNASMSVDIPVIPVNQAGDPLNRIALIPFNNSLGEYIPNVTETIGNDFASDEAVIGLDGFNQGTFEFSQLGDRFMLTQAYDLSSAEEVTVSFDFTFDGNIQSDVLTIPRFQVSTDGGATFQNVSVDNDDVLGEGLMFLNTNYDVTIPSALLTEATHFRWYQPINLGSNADPDADKWSVSNIEINLETGNQILTYYQPFNSPQNVTVNAPNEDHYVWSHVDGNIDPVFNGEDFRYDWSENPTLDPAIIENYPAGTEFTFYLPNVTDDNTGEPLILGTVSTLGEFEASIPLYVGAGLYNVNVYVSIEYDPELPAYEYRDYNVGQLRVYNEVVEAIFVDNGDALSDLYAGSTVSFEPRLENFESTATTGIFDNLFFNLIMNYDGKDWLVGTQLGPSGQTTIDLLPFVQGANLGDFDFEFRVSQDAALGEIGTEIVPGSNVFEVLADENNFINTFSINQMELNNNESLVFEPVSGRRTVTTVDFETLGATRISFDLAFDETSEDLTSSQYLVFEYSTDGGTTYTEIDSYPNPDMPAMTASGFYSYRFDDIGGTVLSENTRFRFRQEESQGYIQIDNLNLSFGSELPFASVPSQNMKDIEAQALLITNQGTSEICSGGEVTLDYEVRGRFGADNLVNVFYNNAADDYDEIVEGYSYSIVEGTGSITFTMPTVLAQGDDNDFFFFQLQADDDTYSNFQGNNYSYTVENAPYSNQVFEVVAPVDNAATLTVLGGNQLTCNPMEKVVAIDAPQNHFTYQVIDFNTGALIGDPLTYDPTDGLNEINIGITAESVNLGLLVTSRSSTGLTECNTIKSTEFSELFVIPNSRLFISAGNSVVPVQEGTIIDVCTSVPELTMGYYDNNGVFVTGAGNWIWYRDDLSTPLSQDEVFGDDETFDRTGDYFAQYTEGGCVYASMSITVEVPEKPARPMITSTGSLLFCEGSDNEVVLSGPEGFAFYQWTYDKDDDGIDDPFDADDYYTLDVNTREVVISTPGFYRLQVSNNATAVDCELSNMSDPIAINYTEDPNISIGGMPAGTVVDVCDSDVVTIDNNPGGGVINWYRDGAAYAITSVDGDFVIDESGTYYAEVVIGQNNQVCVYTTPEVTYNVAETPDTPLLTTADDRNFCAGDGTITLTAPEGFEYYVWRLNGVPKNTAQNGYAGLSEIEVTETGRWTVEVSNLSTNTCLSEVSNAIELVEMPAAAPVLTATGDLSFCVGEGTVTLTAPTGFEYYTWYRNGAPMNNAPDGFENSNEIVVSTKGSYTVAVSNLFDRCESARSNAIVVSVPDEPMIPSLDQVNTTCGDGAIEFSIYNSNNNAMTYQLYNGETGQPSGNAVTIQSFETGSVFTDVVSEDGTPFYVEVTYANGVGCSNVDPSIYEEAEVRTITLEIEGATLSADYPGSNSDIRWYRNEVLLSNATGDQITITDAAEYTVEVEYEDGCLLTASSADIDGRVLSNRDAMEMLVTSYPNPAQSDITLNVNSQYMGKHEVIVTSMTGQIMMQSSFEKSNFEAEHPMDINNLQKGIYNVQIRHDGLTQNVRIIKK